MLSRSLESFKSKSKEFKYHYNSLECVNSRAPKARVEGALVYDDYPFGCFHSPYSKKRVHFFNKKVCFNSFQVF